MSTILSIQSHVVHGYVGNKAAVFPLQLLGFDVDVINSVQFSNHTGYKNGFKGQVLQGSELEALVEGLDNNKLINASTSHLLTGYIGSETFLNSVLTVIDKIKSINANYKFVCDPVLGDNGKLYVPSALPQIYIDKIIKRAYMITPNSFEVEQLTGVSIKSLDDAVKGCNILHDMGPEIVCITSMNFYGDEGYLTILISLKNKKKFKCRTEKIPGSYTGTGDLTAALLLAWEHKLGCENIDAVLKKVVNTVHRVIRKTLKDTGEGDELRLIQSKKIIECGGEDDDEEEGEKGDLYEVEEFVV